MPGMSEHDPATEHAARVSKVARKLDEHEREAVQRRIAVLSEQLDHLNYDHLPVVPRTRHRATLAAELAELLQILCDDDELQSG